MIIITFYDGNGGIQFEVSFDDKPLELLDNSISPTKQAYILRAIATQLFTHENHLKLVRVSLIKLKKPQLTIWCTTEQDGFPSTKEIDINLNTLPPEKDIPVTLKVSTSHESKYCPAAMFSKSTTSGVIETFSYENLRKKAFNNGTLTHQLKRKYPAIPLKALLKTSGTIINSQKLPVSLREIFNSFQTAYSNRLNKLEKLKLALEKLKKYNFEKEAIKGFIDREEESIRSYSPDEFFEKHLFDRLVFQELDVKQRDNFSINILKIAFYNAAVEIYNQYVLAKGLSVADRSERKAEFNNIFAAVKVQIDPYDIYVVASSLKVENLEQFTADVNALLSSLKAIEWGTYFNNTKAFARNVLEVELSKAIEHIEKETGRSCIFNIKISPLNNLFWDEPAFTVKFEKKAARFFNLEDEERLSSYSQSFSCSSEKTHDDLWQDADMVLSAKLKEVEALITIEAEPFHKAGAAPSLVASPSSDTSSIPEVASHARITFGLVKPKKQSVKESGVRGPVTPVVTAVPLIIEDSVLLEKIQQTIEETTWVVKNVFGVASFINISMGDNLQDLPKHIRGIYLYITRSKDDATQKMDSVKILADEAITANNKRRIESTQAFYEKLCSRTKRSNQAAYFEKEAAFTNDSGERRSILQQLRKCIEEADWQGANLVSCKMYVRESNGARKLDKNNEPVTRELRLPKHVKEQYEILEGCLSASVAGVVFNVIGSDELVEKKALNKLQQIALDAVHDGGKKTRNNRTKDFYAILSCPKQEMEQKLRDFAAENNNEKKAAHELLKSLKAGIESASWLTQSGRLFAQDRYHMNNYTTVCIDAKAGLEGNHSAIKKNISDLPKNVRKQYELLQKYFEALEEGSHVNAIKTLGKIQEISRNVGAWNLSRRSIMTEDYYAAFKRAQNIEQLQQNLTTVFGAIYTEESYQARR